MMNAVETVLSYFTTLPLWELIAVFTALTYTILAAKGSIWCWPAALISTVIYTVIFYDVYLWMDSFLQVYYLGMAIFGWYCWAEIKQKTQLTMFIARWSIIAHAKIIASLSLISIVVGWLMATYTPASFPYFDAFTTIFAIFATYMLTKQILESWVYWFVIDAASIYIYIEKDLTPTAVLFSLYVFLTLYGYYQWLKMFNRQRLITAE
jgi:nicotinamide mononucleotide transporter